MNKVMLKDKNLYYIGGIVRDMILNKESFDIDITYVGNAIEYAQTLNNIEIIKINEPFGTVKIKHNGQEIDLASTRNEIYPKAGHLPVVVEIGCSLKKDVERRDFTINTLAKSLETGEIIDYLGGLKDIESKTIRVLHDNSFVDDPTRIIRALKFSVRFGFDLDSHTKELQTKYLQNINYDMSYKRMKKELFETFQPYYTPHPSYGHPAWLFAFNGSTECSAGSTPPCASSALSEQSALPVGAREEKKQPSCPVAIWLIYVGILGDLSRLPLTKIEQKILDDVPKEVLKTDFELYKTFQNARIETILLYAILKDEAGARHYLDDLQKIKLEITGKDLLNLGIKPSPEYQKIFDEVLKVKLKNPSITKEDEIKLAKELV